MNSGQLPTYKTLSPVLRTQTTYDRKRLFLRHLTDNND